jgi:hypothetical protein
MTTPNLEPIAPGNAWDHSRSDALAWSHFAPKLIDYAIDLTSTFTPNNLGLAWALMDAPTHIATFGVPPQPLAVPGPCPQQVPEREDWKIEHRNYEKQQAALLTLRQYVMKTVPQHLLAPMEVNKSLRTRSLDYIFMTLNERFSQLKIKDIQLLKQNLIKPYPENGKIGEFTANQLRILDDLTQAGQPLSNMEATEAIKSSFNTIDFAPCWAEFLKDYGAINQQTPANLCPFVVTFVEQRLEHHRAARIALGTANSASAIPLLQNNGIVETELVANSNNAAAVAIKANKPRKANPPKQPRLPPPGFPPYWCWSCPNPNNHWSHNCPNRLPGHKWKATKEDPMNSPHL